MNRVMFIMLRLAGGMSIILMMVAVRLNQYDRAAWLVGVAILFHLLEEKR